MIAKLEWTKSNVQQNIEQLKLAICNVFTGNILIIITLVSNAAVMGTIILMNAGTIVGTKNRPLKDQDR